MRYFIFVFALLMLVGCTSKSPEPKNEPYYDDGTLSVELQGELKYAIDKYAGTRTGGDCSGIITVLNRDHNGLFFDDGELNSSFDRSGRKSQAMYNLYSKNGKISYSKPKVGDLVFFKNTTRRTLNSKKNNVTHVGLVSKIYSNGRIEFFHFAGGKNRVDYMNLNAPKVYSNKNGIQNSYIVRCRGGNISCLASNKFVGFGVVEE
ncbi:MAG: NlpC/P60 family protein [Campylobacter sp.]|nr:NlpC/P60 family protein [Campylobacter sp.]